MSEHLSLKEDSEFILSHPILKEMHDSITELTERIRKLEASLEAIIDAHHLY